MIVIIAIVSILIVIAFLKFENYRQSISVFFLIVFLILAYFSVTAMVNTNQMDFSSPGAIVNSIGVYAGWLGQTTINLIGVGKDTIRTVGNVINTNQTSKTN